MKKIILLSFIGMLLTVFSVSAHAMEFKAFGLIDAQWQYNINASSNNTSAGIYNVLPANFKWSGGLKGPQLDRKVNYFESRARLGFNAIQDKNLSGTILFEMDSTVWGDTSPSGAQRNVYGYWGGDRAAVEVKNVYLDFGLPYIGIPVPISFRVGLQPIGIRPNIFLTTDGMGITWNTKINPVGIAFFYAKPYEGRTAVSQDDADVLGGHITAKVGPLTAGGYALYYNMNAYPFPAAALSYGSTGSFDAEMWWFGLYADGKVGPVNVNLDGIYDRGRVMPRESAGYFGVPEVKYRGWAARAKIDFPWEKFNFGVTGYYATGADTEDTSASGLPGTSTSIGTISTKVTSYVVPPGSEAGSNFGESVVFYSFGPTRGATGIANNANYTQMSRGPIGGTWMAKAYASVKAASWYKITLQGMYIGDTTKNGDTFGTAASWNPVYGNILRDKKDIGWEIDLINEINIYKNLKLTVAGGYLFAGKAMDRYTGATIFGVPLNDEIKNPWAITWNLTYRF